MRRLVSLIVVAVCVAFWVVILGSPLAVVTTAAADRPARPLWSRAIGKPAGVTSLHAVDGVVVAGTWEVRVVGLDGRTGRKLWQQQRPGEPGWDLLVAVSGGRVVAATSEHPAVVAYEPRTGKRAWERELEPIGSMAGCPGHRLVAVTHRGRTSEGAATLLVHALDPASGQTLWQTPVDGTLQGSGDGWLFTARASGTGQLMTGLAAVRCSDGAVRELPAPRRRFSRLLHAAEGKVVGLYFEFTGEQELVCVTEVESGAQQCFEVGDGDSEGTQVVGALLQDGVVHVAAARMYAKNLDPRPDSWLFRYDLAQRRMVGKSEALTSNGALAGGGGQIVTGFGSTGAEDFGHVVEAATGQRLASVRLRKSPTAVALDGARGYFGTYGGEVVAVALPRPGPTPVAEVAVAPRAVVKGTPGPDLGWRVVRTFDAHPKRARTSGSQVDGHVGAVAFLDDQRLVAGGNDDWVAVFDVAQGKQLWRSKKLGKDVENVAVCERGFAATVYGGNITMFEAARASNGSGRGFVAQKPIAHGMGWMFGMTSGCAIVADDFDGTFKIYVDGREQATFVAPGEFDRRGLAVVGSHLVVSQPGRLEVLHVEDVAAAAATGAPGKAAAVYPTTLEAHGSRLSQAWMLGDGRLLREYCGAVRCVIELVSRDRGAPRTIELDVRGAGWDASVPSMIAAAVDGSVLAFFRRGLDLAIIDTATGKRQSLADLSGMPRDLVVAAFAPGGKRLAVAGYPQPWQVTILERP
jgi:outer membrane protein assembly factor BamB